MLVKNSANKDLDRIVTAELERLAKNVDFVEKVFRGLKKNNEKEFKNISGDFVTKLSNVMWEQHPIGPVCSPDDGTWL